MSYEYLTQSGVIVPDTADVLAAVEAEYRAALGDDLDTSPSTPQGMLIAAEVAARMSVIRNNAALANQINPDIAGGVFLDAIAGLTRLTRNATTKSLIRGVVMSGIPGTVIPSGSRARIGVAGAEFESLSGVVLDVTGTATSDFQAVVGGPVACPAGSLDTIIAGVLGWETVTNPDPAEIGQAQQSDLALRAKRRNTLALQGVSLAEAITSALYAVPGVRSLAFRENPTGATEVIDGISLVAHSVWACVDGGTDGDVAAALLANKSLGAAWNGAETVNVVEPSSGQTYTVKFDRPDPVPVQVRVTVSQGTSTINPAIAVPEAIVAYAQGDAERFGEPGLGVGVSVSPFELSGAINIAYPGLFVRKVEVAKAGDPLDTVELVISLDEIATLTTSSITVVLV